MSSLSIRPSFNLLDSVLQEVCSCSWFQTILIGFFFCLMRNQFPIDRDDTIGGALLPRQWDQNYVYVYLVTFSRSREHIIYSLDQGGGGGMSSHSPHHHYMQAEEKITTTLLVFTHAAPYWQNAYNYDFKCPHYLQNIRSEGEKMESPPSQPAAMQNLLQSRQNPSMMGFLGG